jgi:hypothetical protein
MWSSRISIPVGILSLLSISSTTSCPVSMMTVSLFALRTSVCDLFSDIPASSRSLGLALASSSNDVTPASLSRSSVTFPTPFSSFNSIAFPYSAQYTIRLSDYAEMGSESLY